MGGGKQHHQQTPRPRNVLSSKHPDLKRVLQTSCPHYVFIVCITACISPHFVHQVWGRSGGCTKGLHSQLFPERFSHEQQQKKLVWSYFVFLNFELHTRLAILIRHKRNRVMLSGRRRTGLWPGRGHSGVDGGGGWDGGGGAGAGEGRHAAEWKGCFRVSRLNCGCFWSWQLPPPSERARWEVGGKIWALKEREEGLHWSLLPRKAEIKAQGDNTELLEVSGSYLRRPPFS